MKEYSREEIRLMLCRYHNLDGAEDFCGKTGAEKIMKRIGTIQYDPLNVVSRNADLVLQARVKDYHEEHLFDLLYKDHKLVDGYDKEMSIYTVSDFGHFGFVRRESKNMMLAILNWRHQMAALDILDEVLAYVEENGKTSTKDLSIGKVRNNSNWGHKKLSSAALDYLFNTGVLSVAGKSGTHRYFDLTERVVKKLDGTREDFYSDPNMSEEEFYEWYVERRIKCVGLVWNKSGGIWLGHYLGNSELRTKTIASLEEKGRIKRIAIQGIKEPFYVPKNFSRYMNVPAPEDYARFIAPLDNLMWDRQMLQKLFDFEYRWEVYTPAAKRKYGYYVLPVLYNGNFVARFEPDYAGKTEKFIVKNWWWEDSVKPDKKMRSAIEKEMKRFANFLQVENSADNVKKTLSC